MNMFTNIPKPPSKKVVAQIGIVALVLVILSSLMGSQNTKTSSLSVGSGTYGGAPTAMAPSIMGLVAEDSYGSAGARMEKSYDYQVQSIQPENPPIAGTPILPESRKIIRNGSLQLQVNDVEKAVGDITSLAGTFGGWVESNNISEYRQGEKSGTLTLRVPNDKFDGIIKDIKLLAVRIQNEQVNSQDVSAQVVDLEAQLKNYRAEEAQYQDIMKRAGKITDVLEVARQLSQVRGNIERTQGQLNYLSRQVAMSSIVVSLSPVPQASQVTDDWEPLLLVKESFKHLVGSLTELMGGFIVFLIAILPILILKLAFLALFVYVLYRLIKWGKVKIPADVPQVK